MVSCKEGLRLAKFYKAEDVAAEAEECLKEAKEAAKNRRAQQQELKTKL